MQDANAELKRDGSLAVQEVTMDEERMIADKAGGEQVAGEAGRRAGGWQDESAAAGVAHR